MNLVTAVIVEGAIEQGSADREAHKKQKQEALRSTLPNLLSMFQDLDADGDGTLTTHELLAAPDDLKEELLKYLPVDSLGELMDHLDLDKSGTVELDEFIKGISSVLVTDQTMDSVRIMKQVNISRKCAEMTRDAFP